MGTVASESKHNESKVRKLSDLNLGSESDAGVNLCNLGNIVGRETYNAKYRSAHIVWRAYTTVKNVEVFLILIIITFREFKFNLYISFKHVSRLDLLITVRKVKQLIKLYLLLL